MPRSVTLSFELLETLVALIRAGGEASSAMKGLGINQPTLSKRLKHLQHAGPLLDRPWVERRGKTWSLTEEGKRVWPAVLELVEGHENLQAFLTGEGNAPEAAPVRFACGQTMAAGLVREALRAFREQDSRAMPQISTMRGRARIEGVSNGSLDLAIVTHDEPTILEIVRRPLHIEPLVRHGLLLVCATDSPWSRAVSGLSKEGVPVEALERFPLIIPEADAGVRKGLDEALRRRGVPARLDVALEIGGWGTILAYVSRRPGRWDRQRGGGRQLEEVDRSPARSRGLPSDRGQADRPAPGRVGRYAGSLRTRRGLASDAPPECCRPRGARGRKDSIVGSFSETPR